MTPWMRFLLALTGPLWDLFEHVMISGESDPEKERQLAMSIVREAKDARARQELT